MSPLVALSVLHSGQARADFYLHHWENHRGSTRLLDLDFQAGYFESTANFDVDGLEYVPVSFSRYQRFQTDLQARYGLNPNLTLYGRASWARVQLDHVNRPGSGYGFTDQTLGANYRIFRAQSETGFLGSVDIQAQIDFPLYDNSVSDANLTPHLGDQTLDTTVGAFVTTHLHHGKSGALLAVGGIGYTYRTLNYSTALPWSVSLSFEPRNRGLGGELGVFGVASLSTDPRGSGLLNSSSAFTSPGTGGSYMSASINPSLATAQGRITYDTSDRLQFFALGSKTIYGRAAPAGALFAGGIRFGFGTGGRSRAKDPATMTPQEYGRSNQGLVSYAFEARVLRMNDRLNLVKLDKGSAEGVEVGQIFDLFRPNTDRSPGDAVARAQVTSVKADEAALTVLEYFKEVWIEEGFIAKRPLQ